MRVCKRRFRYLEDDDLARIHDSSIYILTEFGVKFDSVDLRDRLQEYGCTLNGDRVKFNVQLIDKALREVNGSFVLKSPAGKEITIDCQSALAHPGGGMPYILDSGTGEYRKAVNADLITAVHLVNKFDQLDLASAFVYPQDIPSPVSQLKQCECLLRYSEKPLFGVGFSSSEEAQYLVELFRIFADTEKGLPSSFPGIVGISPLSPLYYPKVITDGMEMVISAGIPTAIFVAPIAGISAPLTISGAIAQMNASMLAFMVIGYLINARAPLVYAARLNFANMKSCHSNWGLPEVGIAGAIAAQIASRYGLISDVYGLSTASCTFDGQSGFEKMSNALLPYFSGANILSGSGALANLSVASFEQLAIDNEVLAMLRKLVQGVAVDSDRLALNVIDNVITGGEYLAQEHTVRHLRGGEVFIPRLFYGGNWSEWTGGQKKGVTAKACEMVIDAQATVACFDLPSEIDREIEEVMRTAKNTLLKTDLY